MRLFLIIDRSTFEASNLKISLRLSLRDALSFIKDSLILLGIMSKNKKCSIIEIMALPLGGLAIDWCKRVRRTGPSQILRFHMLMAFQYDVCRLLKYALTLLT
jgi:hypothetical protein